jgi:phenylpyruvate tautomerase PptA (4-oxalocrotonate tautomerase family)
MPWVDVKLAEGDYTEEQRHEMAARLTDVMVALKAQRLL